MKLIKKASMGEPDFFEVIYSINPWMGSATVDRDLARLEWESLRTTLQSLNIEVDTVEPVKTFPDMVFAADQAVVKDHEALISNFRCRERVDESRYYKDWFSGHGYMVKKLPEGVFFEGGGESMWLGDMLLIGAGFRTSMGACKYVSEILEVETACHELVDPKFYHLDTCLFVLNEQTAFYYPDAFAVKSVKRLKGLVKNLIELDSHEAENFAANSLVTDHHVVLQKGNS